MPKLTFGKKEKLKNKRLIEKLFADGKHLFAYPVKLFYAQVDHDESDSPIQFAVTVPKKKFKKAVDRNRLKRLIRESYRLNKSDLSNSIEDKKIHLIMMAVYIADKELTMSDIDKSIKKLLFKLSEKISLPEK